jgi:cation transport ATPase
MDYSNHTALFQPLVGTEPQQQIPGEIPTAEESLSEAEQQQLQESQQSPQQHNHDIWISAVLFALMYIHFGLIYYSDPNHIINGVSWTTINVSITLFIAATYLYRHALHDCQIQNDFMMLLPEFLILLSMAFVFFQYIITAFLLLAVGKLYMAFVVILINSYKLWSLSSTNEEQDQESKDIDSIV